MCLSQRFGPVDEHKDCYRDVDHDHTADCDFCSESYGVMKVTDYQDQSLTSNSSNPQS